MILANELLEHAPLPRDAAHREAVVEHKNVALIHRVKHRSEESFRAFCLLLDVEVWPHLEPLHLDSFLKQKSLLKQ